MIRPRFAQSLKSPHSAPHVGDAIVLTLTPHAFGGYHLAVRLAEGFASFDGLATATDLRELAGKFYAAAAALTGDPAP